jgi:hypothetical protein
VRGGDATANIFEEARTNCELAALYVFRPAVERFAVRRWTSWDRIYAAVAAGKSHVAALPTEGGWLFSLRHRGGTLSLGVATREQIGVALDEHVFNLESGGGSGASPDVF